MVLLAAVVVLGAVAVEVEVEAFSNHPRSDRPIADGPGFVAHHEARNALPTFIWAEAGLSLRAMGLRPEQAARRYLWEYASRYRFAPAELAAVPLANLHDTGEGAIIASFRRPGVFRETLTVVMDRELRAVALTGYLSPGALSESDPKLTLATALSIAVQHATGRWVDGWPEARGERGGWTWYQAGGPAFRARPTRYARPAGFERAWELELDIDDAPFRAVISSTDGRVLHFSSQRFDATHSYRVYGDAAAPYVPWEGPTGNVALPHPTGLPDGFNPAYLPPGTVALDHAGLSTGDPWLPAAATSLHGNNAIAYADRSAPDGLYLDDGGVTTDVETPVSAPGVLDWVYDHAAEPNANAAQRNASSTHAFYVVNWLHDTYYPLGFDEAAGNSQQSNFGRGGDEGDPILVEVQDYRTRNNAAMWARSDGNKPRMELYLFDDISPAIVEVSGALDAGYIVGTSFGPVTYDVTAPLIIGHAAIDGGTDGCRGPFMNVAQVSGAIALLSNNGGRCQPQAQLDNATDAGAVGVVLTAAGNTITNYVGLLPGAKPTVNMRANDSAALMAVLGTGALTARLRREALPDRDSALDSTIVTHEWAHHLSNRLVGDSSGLTTTIGRGLGEGWSDFNALLVLIQQSDAAVPSNPMWKGVWSMAAFSLAPPSLPDQVWYFGIRRFPYSIDRAKNNLSFRHVQDGEPLPTTPSQTAGVANSEFHNTGEVWATALLECYAALLVDPRLTFAEAQRRMRGYLVASLKATPPDPDFLEARDAWLAVAQANDPADRSAFTQAFARRGFGPKATGPDRFAADNKTVVEDFTTSATQGHIDAVTVDDGAPLYCDKDGILDVGEIGEVVVKLRNTGTTMLPASTGTVTSGTSGVTFMNGGTLSFPAVAPYASVTARTPIAYAGTRGPVRLDLTTTVMNPSFAAALTNLTALVIDHDRVPSDTETFEAGGDVWTPTQDFVFTSFGSEQGFQLRHLLVTDTVVWSPTPRVPGATYLASPTLEVGATAPLHVRFRHRHQFRAGGADGALLLISPDDGLTWGRVPASAMTPVYPGTLVNGGFNPLRGGSAPAWTGSSPGYPAMVAQDVDLGTAYAGKKVLISFALGVDQNASGNGWEIDDVRVTGLIAGSDLPFTDLGVEAGACLNRPPVARAGADFAADERGPVHLDPSASTDVDGQTLTLTWAQTAGPTVTLTGGDFTAPDVPVDTPLTFQLTASDGALMSTDDVVVTIRQVNRDPTVTVRGPVSALEGTEIALVAHGEDPDDDPLTFVWRQTSGTAVTLAGQGTNVFATAPAGGGTLGFSVTAEDGVASSPAATVEIAIMPIPDVPPKKCGCGAGPGALALLALAVVRRRRRL